MKDQYYYECIEKAISLYWRTLSKARGMKLFEGEIDYVISCNRDGPESIFNIKIDCKDIESHINYIIAQIKADRIPSRFLIMPNTLPSNLKDILEEKGFNIDISGLCMVKDLNDCNIDNANKEFSIVKVKNKDELKHWVHIVNTALFGYAIMNFEQFYDIFDLDYTNLYILYYKNSPVSVCMSIADNEIASLEMVATVKEHRKKGYATAIMGKALTDLKKNGVKTVSLRAEPDGISIYKKIGFKEYCKRVVAIFDSNSVYKKSCPCFIGSESIEKAKLIYEAADNIELFVDEMYRQNVIGKKIWFEQGNNLIYITKNYAFDNGAGSAKNHSLISQRCHCAYVNDTKEYIAISYCICGAEFFRPMFEPLFGKQITIEPIETVLSGGGQCTFVIKNLKTE